LTLSFQLKKSEATKNGYSVSAQASSNPLMVSVANGIPIAITKLSYYILLPFLRTKAFSLGMNLSTPILSE
jgi:hypothetical protein